MSDAGSPSTEVSVKVGEESVDAVVQAALDIFSAPVNLLGWLGDQIRIHRANTTIKALHRTKELADKFGFQLVAPPTKFLAQFLEASSLEELEDDNLIERWATLLLNASQSFDSEQTFFVSTLKQLGALELELLEVLIRNGRGHYRLSLAMEAQYLFDFSALEHMAMEKLSASESAVDEAIEHILSVFEIAGTIVADVFVDHAVGQGNDRQWQAVHPDFSEDEISRWDMLVACNLVECKRIVWVIGSLVYRVRVYICTELGARFYFASHAPGWGEMWSTDVPYERRCRPRPFHKMSAEAADLYRELRRKNSEA